MDFRKLPPPTKHGASARPVRRAILRGLGVLAPPLLTIVIFLWVGKTIQDYVLDPVTSVVREGLVAVIADIRYDLAPADPSQREVTVNGFVYRRLENDTYIPLHVYEKVRRQLAGQSLPQHAKDYYRQYVNLVWLRPYYVIPLFLAVFTLLLYLLGKFLAAGIGGALWNAFETLIIRVPIVRSVYSAIKQVVDFFFGEREMEFTRVVAIEFPRRGTWTVGFVVSEGFDELAAAANEPVLSVWVPCSPAPMSGFIITLPKREVLDLNVTVDQALQYVISCGVVVPPQQLQQKTLMLRSDTRAVPATPTPANADTQ